MRLRLLLLGSLISFSIRAAELDAVVSGNREFACRLFRELADESGNLFFSPHSISVALAMTYAGAREETAEQMRQALSLPGGPDDIPPLFRILDETLSGAQEGGGVTWSAANSIWPHRSFTFREAFLSTIRNDFRSDIHPADFGQPEEARTRINRWVEDQTREKIKDLIAPGILNPLTRMVLVNAVYFKGRWETPFMTNLTTALDFTLDDGEVIKTPTMYGKVQARLGEAEGIQLLELPYQGRNFALLIALPGNPDARHALESGLDRQTLDAWSKGLRQEEVRVFLPKFSMTSQFGLTSVLTALGMKDAFIEGVANFSGMDGEPDNLFISDVIHKAFVDVGEEGTEAAAATGVIMQARAMPRPSPEFRADRPFLFFIIERETGSVLFAGRLADPR